MLGKTFTRDGLAALVGACAERARAAARRRSCARRCSALQADPRSPEHGQYGFLQDLVRHVAYETLSRHERRARHLAAAEHLRAAFPDEDEIAEVIAAHYLDAYEANPAGRRRGARSGGKAREALVRAGERAESLAAAGEAQRYLEQAASLTDDPRERAALLDRAGWLAYHAADLETRRAAARRVGRALRGRGRDARGGPGLEPARFRRALAGALRRGARADGARVTRCSPQTSLTRISRCSSSGSEARTSSPAISIGAWRSSSCAIEIGESLGSADVLAPGLPGQVACRHGPGRSQESLAYARQALAIALEHDHETRRDDLLQPLRSRVPPGPVRGRARLPGGGSRVLTSPRLTTGRMGDAR